MALAQKAFAANKPVLVYNEWYEPPAEVLTEFDLAWDWWGGQPIGDLPSAGEQCLQASTSSQVQELMVSLQQGMPDYSYTSTICTDYVGTTTCSAGQLVDSQGKTAETAFFQGARTIRDQLSAMDAAGKNVFSLDNGNRLLKLAVLLGDKYRAGITYPMDKVATPESTFYKALYTDYTVHYARPDNDYQPNMGKFTDAQVALNAEPTISQTVTLTPTTFDEWTSTGLYAPPGKTITVRRTDSGSNTVNLRFNMLRGTTRVWNTNGYNRPALLDQPCHIVESGPELHLIDPLWWADLPELGWCCSGCSAVYRRN